MYQEVAKENQSPKGKEKKSLTVDQVKKLLSQVKDFILTDEFTITCSGEKKGNGTRHHTNETLVPGTYKEAGMGHNLSVYWTIFGCG